MTNMEQPAPDLITIVAPSGGLTVGVPALVGAMVVIPTKTVAQGEKVAVYKGGGQFRVPKKAATAFATVGALVDWDPTPGEVVAHGNVATNFDLGFVVKAAGASDTHISISLIPGAVTAQAGA